jgi:hypothetical protein
MGQVLFVKSPWRFELLRLNTNPGTAGVHGYNLRRQKLLLPPIGAGSNFRRRGIQLSSLRIQVDFISFAYFPASPGRMPVNDSFCRFLNMISL